MLRHRAFHRDGGRLARIRLVSPREILAAAGRPGQQLRRSDRRTLRRQAGRRRRGGRARRLKRRRRRGGSGGEGSGLLGGRAGRLGRLLLARVEDPLDFALDEMRDLARAGAGEMHAVGGAQFDVLAVYVGAEGAVLTVIVGEDVPDVDEGNAGAWPRWRDKFR